MIEQTAVIAIYGKKVILITFVLYLRNCNGSLHLADVNICKESEKQYLRTCVTVHYTVMDVYNTPMLVSRTAVSSYRALVAKRLIGEPLLFYCRWQPLARVRGASSRPPITWALNLNHQPVKYNSQPQRTQECGWADQICKSSRNCQEQKRSQSLPQALGHYLGTGIWSMYLWHPY